MGLCDRVRENAAVIAASARHVRIDLDRVADIEPGPPPVLDPERHYLDGSREDVAAYLLTLDAINFGSGWFPTLRKRPGCSGYYTVSWALADKFRAGGPWTNEELRAMDADDVGFWKRAQITANDFQLAGILAFDDIDELTIFADNLVPHVLRVDGVLRYDDELAARIDGAELIPAGSEEETEIRGCAVHACELIAAELGIPARDLDVMLWNRGQGERYKSRPRHRTRTVYY
jgi:hypothetical protein